MIATDTDTQQRMSSDPAFRAETLRRMAEWTVFYDQLNLWRMYVEQHVIHDSLPKEDLPTFDPTVVDTELPALYEKMKTHAAKITEEETNVYQDVIKKVQTTTRQQEDYKNWLDDREREIINFAEDWRHNYDGTQVSIGDTVYLVRTPKHKAKLDAQGRPIEEYIPTNAVVIDVPQEKVVTPFDLINKDGTLKKPVER